MVKSLLVKLLFLMFLLPVFCFLDGLFVAGLFCIVV